MTVDDIIDELYAFCYDSWTESIRCILKMLNFPVRLDAVSGREGTINCVPGQHRLLDSNQKRTFSICKEVALFSMSGNLKQIKILAVFIGEEHRRLRNEKTCEIYRAIRQIYGKYTLFISCCDGGIAFVGTSFDKSGAEVIISDWYSLELSRETLSRILDIDCALYSNKSIGCLYSDYIWSISRPYIRNRESKSFLMYGCMNVQTYESVFQNEEDGSVYYSVRPDFESTYMINALYYRNIYGDDYFLDTSVGEESDDYDDDEDNEYDWTLLELELSHANTGQRMASRNIEASDSEYNDSVVPSGFNPEEMLDYIQNL